jgi:hypothetical protein
MGFGWRIGSKEEGDKTAEGANFAIKCKNPRSHLLFKCRFSIRVWTKVKQWLGLQDIDPSSWNARRTVKEWWTEEIHKQGPSKKAMASLAMLISWEIWMERNTHVFRNTYTTSSFIIIKINEEIALWSLAGAKTAGNVMPQE